NGSSNASQSRLNCFDNIMSWYVYTDSHNTNLTTITEASLGPYASSVAIYRCPSDRNLSDKQHRNGYSARIRRYSMNAMVGDAGDVSKSGVNENNPGYVQFFKASSIPQPT